MSLLGTPGNQQRRQRIFELIYRSEVPLDAGEVARLTNIGMTEVEKILGDLHGRAVLSSRVDGDRRVYYRPERVSLLKEQ